MKATGSGETKGAFPLMLDNELALPPTKLVSQFVAHPPRSPPKDPLLPLQINKRFISLASPRGANVCGMHFERVNIACGPSDPPASQQPGDDSYTHARTASLSLFDYASQQGTKADTTHAMCVWVKILPLPKNTHPKHNGGKRQERAIKKRSLGT